MSNSLEQRMIPPQFADLMIRHRILVGIVMSVSRGEIEVVGDRTTLESDDLLETWFNDVATLNAYLDGQILPRMVQQGRVAGVICKPNADTIVGLLYHDERDVVQRYHHGKQLNDAVVGLWS